MTRRELLKRAGSITLGGLALSTSTLTTALCKEGGAPVSKENPASVPKRPFGKTGVQVSCLGLGGTFNTLANTVVLNIAMKHGITYWDTAHSYQGGNSEKGIGRFFDRYPDARREVFLVSKTERRDPESMTRELTASLERMKTDSMDMYMLHGLSDFREITPEILDWVDKAKHRGQIRWFGFSTHKNMETCMKAAAGSGWIDGIMMSYNFRLMDSGAMISAIEACAEAGIGLTAMKTQGRGLIAAEHGYGSEKDTLSNAFKAEDFTPEQLKLMAVWANPQIATICSRMPNTQILKDNVAAALHQAEFTEKHKKVLDTYAAKTAASYCAGCGGFCESALEKDVPVADVMRCLMYFHGYGDYDTAKTAYDQITRRRRCNPADKDFSRAEKRCPQGLEIGALMKEAETLFSC